MGNTLSRKTSFVLTIATTVAATIIGLGQACSRTQLKEAPFTPPYKRVSLKVAYCPEAGGSLRAFYARNLSAVSKDFSFENDTDRDGLADSFEENVEASAFATTKTSSDSNGDGYTDFAMVKAGYKSSIQQSLALCPDPNLDTDNDGLSDCDETILRTSEIRADTDGDAIPDFWEVYYGLNPLDPFDAEQDMDLDGVSNVTEVQLGTPVNTSNEPEHRNVSYLLGAGHSHEIPLDCEYLSVSNIPVLNLPSGNLVRMDILEVDGRGVSTIKRVQFVVPYEVEDNKVFEQEVNLK